VIWKNEIQDYIARQTRVEEEINGVQESLIRKECIKGADALNKKI